MNYTKKIISTLLCLFLMCCVFVPTCLAYEYYPEDTENMSKDAFSVILKEDYYYYVQDVLDSIDCEYVKNASEIRTLSFDGTPKKTTIFIQLTDEKYFEAAQDYFREQEYCFDIHYEYLVPLSAPEKGDVNYDGKITADDARLVLRAAVGLEELAKYSADVDGDGKITANDARMILRNSVGLVG